MIFGERIKLVACSQCPNPDGVLACNRQLVEHLQHIVGKTREMKNKETVVKGASFHDLPPGATGRADQLQAKTLRALRYYGDELIALSEQIEGELLTVDRLPCPATPESCKKQPRLAALIEFVPVSIGGLVANQPKY